MTRRGIRGREWLIRRHDIPISRERERRRRTHPHQVPGMHCPQRGTPFCGKRFPQNAKAVKSVFPTMDGSPFFGQISRRQIHDIQDRLFVEKRDARPDRFTQAQVERFYGVGRIDNLAYLRWKLKKGDDTQPIPPPQGADRRVSLIPLLAKSASCRSASSRLAAR